MALSMEINLSTISDPHNNILLLSKELIIPKEFYVCNSNNMQS